MEHTTYFADLLLPLPLQGLFTYRIPHDFPKKISFGMRVVVSFGKNKLYSALVVNVHQKPPNKVNTKYVLDVIDDSPVVTEKQFAFWKWLSQYYMCNLGEVMAAALPSAMKIASETRVMIAPDYSGDFSILNEKEIKVVEALSYRDAMNVGEIANLLDVKKIIPIIKTLVEKGIVITDEEIRNPYKTKTETFIWLTPDYQKEENLHLLIDEMQKSIKNSKQIELLLAFIVLNREITNPSDEISFCKPILKNELLKRANAPSSRLNRMIEKGIFELKEVKVSRLEDYDSSETVDSILLSDAQQFAIEEIEKEFDGADSLRDHERTSSLEPSEKKVNRDVVLLHGVTGSGKTELYIKLIDKVLKEGRQVLYLLPEIALTSQIVNRLRKYFGDRVGVYHSRFNEYEKVEIWDRVLHHGQSIDGGNKYQLILGARSALLLPYSNLGLIIVDEEHDPSYKQLDPAPRYHARDGAIVLAANHQAKVLLGTATPSLESYFNVKSGKYGLVQLSERFAGSTLPEIWLVDMQETIRQKKMQGHFSHFLLENIRKALANSEQVIIFQNRRGFSLRLVCHTCQAMPSCKYCDVTLTYHKKSGLLKCHYCGYAIQKPDSCPECDSKDIEMKGFGTEKVEESLEEIFPEAQIVRMDMDTTRSKTAYQKIISDFENQKTNILVGTQMVTKGLDFDRVSVVGILNADNLISYPDFRAFERAYQLMAQVSGRAGRKLIPGKVIIQTGNPSHPALQYVVGNDYESMYQHQIAERSSYNYPPFCRLIKVTVKHKEEEAVNNAAALLTHLFRETLPAQILGPEFPLVARIQNLYLKDIWIKLPKDSHLEKNKQKIEQAINKLYVDYKFKRVRVIVNVDA